MPHHILTPVEVGRTLQFSTVQSVVMTEPVQQPQLLLTQGGIIQLAVRIAEGRFSQINLRIEFGAVAGGNNDQLVQSRQGCRALYRIRHFLRRKSNPLTKVDVRGVVIDTE